MAHKEWQAVLKDGREIFTGGSDKVTDTGGVRSNDEGETGRQESWQAIRRATKTHSPEDREV
jgi:hypothetical protein